MFSKPLVFASAFALGVIAQNATYKGVSTSGFVPAPKLASSTDRLTTTASSASSSSITAATVLTLFADENPGIQYAGSIVNIDCDETTIALECMAGTITDGYLSTTCDGSGTPVLATYGGSSQFDVLTTLNTDGGVGVIAESCTLAGTTQAVCSVSISISADGQDTKTQSVVTYRGAEASQKFYQVPITAGNSLLAQSSTCTASAGAAAPTGMSQIYKVIVVPGAALLAAGALM